MKWHETRETVLGIKIMHWLLLFTVGLTIMAVPFGSPKQFLSPIAPIDRSSNTGYTYPR